MPSLFKTIAGHKRTFIAILVGLISYWLITPVFGLPLHGIPKIIAAWDIGSLIFLGLCVILFSVTPASLMPANAEAQQEGEWTVFVITVLGVAASFAAITAGFSGGKNLTAGIRELHVGLVALTLLVSWLVMQTTFAMRYAHEYYQLSSNGQAGNGKIDGGLEFPSQDEPDYWDFIYFSIVLGMTFQVSDVQITSRKLRRVATVHGFLGFVFNTVIIAVTVNIASGFLS